MGSIHGLQASAASRNVSSPTLPFQMFKCVQVQGVLLKGFVSLWKYAIPSLLVLRIFPTWLTRRYDMEELFTDFWFHFLDFHCRLNLSFHPNPEVSPNLWQPIIRKHVKALLYKYRGNGNTWFWTWNWNIIIWNFGNRVWIKILSSLGQVEIAWNHSCPFKKCFQRI